MARRVRISHAPPELTVACAIPFSSFRHPSPCCMTLPPDLNTQRLRERADTIVWIKTQMAKFGLHLVDLQKAGCFVEQPAPSLPGPVRFRDAQGHAWDGHGDLPDWLERAVNAGQTIAHFQIEK